MCGDEDGKVCAGGAEGSGRKSEERMGRKGIWKSQTWTGEGVGEMSEIG